MPNRHERRRRAKAWVGPCALVRTSRCGGHAGDVLFVFEGNDGRPTLRVIDRPFDTADWRSELAEMGFEPIKTTESGHGSAVLYFDGDSQSYLLLETREDGTINFTWLPTPQDWASLRCFLAGRTDLLKRLVFAELAELRAGGGDGLARG